MQQGFRLKVLVTGVVLASLVALVALGGCERKPKIEPPKIDFVLAGEGYSTKPDFALIEHLHPIPIAELVRITPEYLAGLEQEQVDQIYARLSAGPIPDGAFDGALFFPKGSSGTLRASEIVGGLKGLAVQFKGRKLEALGAALWKGKVFYRDERVLRNRIEDLAVLKPLIGGSLADIPKIDVDDRDAWLLFPAKLYCGQSLLDGRRESIIIDYAFSDDLPGYRERPDYLATRRGFKVRDEIRMVRPGFYLGRAYLDHAFVLNFTLYNLTIAERDGPAFMANGQAQEDCWAGTQQRHLLVSR
ncbi:MAG: hypothetical protein HY941_03265 [Gammaproteobacteria bacterium]|nr:hypothetical protein [Gammaproteobacteria bacterium]